MTAQKHSAGPWQGCLHLRDNADETCGCGYRGGIWSTTADTMICEMGGPTDEYGGMIPRGDRATQIADHWLICAAPDLLATLKALRNECSGKPRAHMLPALLRQADAVIARAEGQS